MQYLCMQYCVCAQKGLVSNLVVTRLPSEIGTDANKLKRVNGCWQTWVLIVFSQVMALFNVKSSSHLNKAHDVHLADQKCTSGMYFSLFLKWCWAS